MIVRENNKLLMVHLRNVSMRERERIQYFNGKKNEASAVAVVV